MSTMTYAQALNEAKQMIVQQQLRIKADAEKVRAQQQTIVDQSQLLSDSERRGREQSAELQRLVEEASTTGTTVQELTTAKEQAEAIIDRQGVRLTQMQDAAAELEKRVSEQASQISELTAQIDQARSQLPTREDEEALSSMNDLLARRTAAIARKTGSTLRMSDDAGSDSSESVPQSIAA